MDLFKLYEAYSNEYIKIRNFLIFVLSLSDLVHTFVAQVIKNKLFSHSFIKAIFQSC